jgi:site-specific DNA-methyltransferase (adenine-specific)
LTVTSPPYDNLRTYNGYTFDFETIAKQLYRVTKDGGVLVWVVGDATIDGSETGTSFKQALYFKEIGFNLHDTMIYQKNGVAYPDKTRYWQTFEYMFVFSKGKPKTINQISDKKNKLFGTKFYGHDRDADGTLKKKWGYGHSVKEFSVRTNIWTDMHNDRYTGHPAPFPEDLAGDHILSWSSENDNVLDCFMGSGTTGKMSILNKRNFIGIEISQEYMEIAQKRIKDVEQQMRLF